MPDLPPGLAPDPTPRPPARSGFCGWPLTTTSGKASHARCWKPACPCLCHLMARIPVLPETQQPTIRHYRRSPRH